MRKRFTFQPVWEPKDESNEATLHNMVEDKKRYNSLVASKPGWLLQRATDLMLISVVLVFLIKLALFADQFLPPFVINFLNTSYGLLEGIILWLIPLTFILWGVWSVYQTQTLKSFGFPFKHSPFVLSILWFIPIINLFLPWRNVRQLKSVSTSPYDLGVLFGPGDLLLYAFLGLAVNIVWLSPILLFFAITSYREANVERFDKIIQTAKEIKAAENIQDAKV